MNRPKQCDGLCAVRITTLQFFLLARTDNFAVFTDLHIYTLNIDTVKLENCDKLELKLELAHEKELG